MSTQQRIEANRRNAKKSTGPRTSRGKQTAAKKSLKHGLLAVSPVLRDVESKRKWEQHRQGLFASFRPEGYLEEILTDRLANLTWRLTRATRFETEVVAASRARIVADVEEDVLARARIPVADIEELRKAEKEASLVKETFSLLYQQTVPDDHRIDRETAIRLLWAVARHFGLQQLVSFPGTPGDDCDWTAAVLRQAVQCYASVAKCTIVELIRDCMKTAHEKHLDSLEDIRRHGRWVSHLHLEGSTSGL